MVQSLGAHSALEWPPSARVQAPRKKPCIDVGDHCASLGVTPWLRAAVKMYLRRQQPESSHAASVHLCSLTHLEHHNPCRSVLPATLTSAEPTGWRWIRAHMAANVVPKMPMMFRMR